jgi:polyphosphate kinase
MPRNFFRRIEIAFPVRGKKQRSRVIEEGIQVMLEDNCTAWEMASDGTYELQTPGKTIPFDAQEELLKSLCQQYG